jgi:flavodoxin
MKKILIAYYSRGGTTETMALYIAEGVRIAGQEQDMHTCHDYGKLVAAILSG